MQQHHRLPAAVRSGRLSHAGTASLSTSVMTVARDKTKLDPGTPVGPARRRPWADPQQQDPQAGAAHYGTHLPPAGPGTGATAPTSGGQAEDGEGSLWGCGRQRALRSAPSNAHPVLLFRKGQDSLGGWALGPSLAEHVLGTKPRDTGNTDMNPTHTHTHTSALHHVPGGTRQAGDSGGKSSWLGRWSCTRPKVRLASQPVGGSHGQQAPMPIRLPTCVRAHLCESRRHPKQPQPQHGRRWADVLSL